MLLERISKLLNFTGATQALNAIVFEHCKARGVIAAIFEPSQALQQNWDYISFGNGADNSTHTFSLRGGVLINWSIRSF